MNSNKNLWDPKIEILSKENLWEKIEKPLLHSQLDYVFKNSQFYKQKYLKIGLNPSELFKKIKFSDLPLTEKKEIMEDQKKFPPFGNILSVSVKKLRRIHRTSGSSGQPIFIALTKNDIEWTLEAGARSFWCAGIRPNDLIIHCLNYCLWSGGITDHLCLEQTGACVIPYGVGNSRNLLEIIKYLHPTAISCTPSYLPKLEVILRDEFKLKPTNLGLKKGLFGGEPGIQNHIKRKMIEKKWKIKAIDANYGMADVLSVFGSECEYRQGLHFHAQGILYTELINPTNKQNLDFKKGQVGELVFTTLRREGQPLIRYRSNDLVKIVGVGPCKCGRNGFRFNVIGRTDDMLIVKGINVFPMAIEDVILKFPSLTGEFEIILKTSPPYDFLRIKVEYIKNINKESVRSVAKLLQKTLRDLLEFKSEIEMVPDGKILRTDGKIKRIKRLYL